ncbi:MAG: hypothetical protein JXM79_07215, partial [Sedimentisphaerales bacterium]|nr:hypothetical protein [Sedimentisphaerales bacterium]
KSDVYVGLAVSAHDPDAVCEAKFSNVATIGNVAPAGVFNQSQDVGISSNAPSPLYVRLEDTTGKPGTVFHEDGQDAVLHSEWTQWAIPLEDFQTQGIDITTIKEIALGVGDKDNPQPGGTGMLIVDDIHVVRRMPVIGKTILFEEDFEGLALGPNVDETLAGDEVWTKTPPLSWVIDDSGVPGVGDPATDGVTEWAGWSFADKNWWIETAGDQQRSQFVLGNGIVAIVDPDEWDDQNHASGLLSSFLSTPAIDISSIEAGTGTLQLKFDSSWREEDTQTANITVSFDGAEPIEVMRWESSGDNTGFLKPDAVSETVTVTIDRPSGAETMVITFGMFNAGNDWWWAIDNVQVSGIPRERIVALYEDFEGSELGQSPEEDPGSMEVWTETPPPGWSVDESGVPGIGNPAIDGVTDWAGWAFANKEWWIAVAGDQRRSEFELGQGTVAIADPDEWDDSTHPNGYNVAEDSYDTWLSTPSINVTDFEAGSVQLKFDSSWRPEFDSNYHQTANVVAIYDVGGSVEVLRWESDGTSPYFKPDDSTNETIVLNLDIPAEATSVVFTFGLFDAGNDWWWAIDNIEISGLPKEDVVSGWSFLHAQGNQ